MKIGLPGELLHLQWVLELKKILEQILPGSHWVHDPPRDSAEPQFLDRDVCFPFKKVVKTSLGIAPQVDRLLVPRIVSLDGFLMCPNFRALPDIVRIHIEKTREISTVPMVTPLLEANNCKDINEVARAVINDMSPDAGPRFRADIPCDHEPSAESGGKDLSGRIGLVGHPYVLGDPKLNSGVPEMLRAEGHQLILPGDIPFRELDRLAGHHDYYAKKMYWKPGREILGAFIYLITVARPAGIIQLVAFNCGIEALLRIELMSLYRKIKNPPPFMVLVCDEHTQRDHVVTRVEAFLDMVYGIRIN